MFRHFSVSRFWCGRAQCKYPSGQPTYTLPPTTPCTHGAQLLELPLSLPLLASFRSVCLLSVVVPSLSAGYFLLHGHVAKWLELLPHPLPHPLLLSLPPLPCLAPPRIMLRQCKYYCTKPMPQSSAHPNGFAVCVRLCVRVGVAHGVCGL